MKVGVEMTRSQERKRRGVREAVEEEEPRRQKKGNDKRCERVDKKRRETEI